ncbi:MAG TPA: SUMF1/EgtB/PvdO family nonheme iron enzyme [Blastocatellia bacterium]|nr:SUMF1/EgtB/PvdO family nonheme iron enzyme [Blastocatellia bacterium]
MTNRFDADQIAGLMDESRRHTGRLMNLVINEADLRRSPGLGFRPILWHLGHVGAFEGYWILQRIKGDPTISRRYDEIFDPIKTPREDSTNLPPISEIENYLDRVRGEVLRFLERFQPGDEPLLRDGYVFDMVIEHEYQHQETVAYLLQMLDPRLKRAQLAGPVGSGQTSNEEHRIESMLPRMVNIAGGPFEIGSDGYHFAYDNERPQHTLELGDFRIDTYPVTAGEFAEFIGARGYQTRSVWSDEGWDWKETNKIDCPEYWSVSEAAGSAESRFRVREMFEDAAIKVDHPVTGVSWYEAEAYARFVGKRLPSEAEWEKAASWDPVAGRKRRFSWGDAPGDHGNFGFQHWGTVPVDAFVDGANAYGCLDMNGNVWEWTASRFEGYPGFKAFPYPEYSEIWFDGDHRVMKGGSWATRLPLLRCSFRNFWRPRFRVAFGGFRCAAD